MLINLFIVVPLVILNLTCLRAVSPTTPDRVGEDFNLKDLNHFFKGFVIFLQKEDIEFGIDLTFFVLSKILLLFKIL